MSDFKYPGYTPMTDADWGAMNIIYPAAKVLAAKIERAVLSRLPKPDAELAALRIVYERAKRLVSEASFCLGGTLNSESKREDIPSRAGSQVKARHLASLRDAIRAVPLYTHPPQDTAEREALVERIDAWFDSGAYWREDVADMLFAIRAYLTGGGA